jgi:hypothetical protein
MSETNFSGAPFGSNCARFHPDRFSKTGTNEKLGPGCYNADTGAFTTAAVAKRSSGPGWARAYETSHMTAIPYLLHKEEWEKKIEMKYKLGPGSYNVKDSIEVPPERQFSRGLLDMREARFRDNKMSVAPGPGTYGKGGVPHAVMEEKERESCGTVGMLDCGGNGLRSLPLVGSRIGPGTYKITGSIDELTRKQVGLKGPYEVFSADRSKPINTGHYAHMLTYNLGPGQYNIRSMTDEMFTQPLRKHGEFGKAAQYPVKPIDRIIASTLALKPRDSTEPGPGHYDAQDPNTKTESFLVKQPPFLSSSVRTDKMAMKFFTGNHNPVGPGRYDVHKHEDAQDINACQSAFKSKTDRPSGQRLKLLQERLRAKNIPVNRRTFLVPDNEPKRCVDVGQQPVGLVC